MTATSFTDVAPARTTAVTLAVFYAAGGLAVLLVALGADSSGIARPALLAVALSASAVAGAAVRWGPRWPQWVFHTCVAAGSGLITITVLVSSGAASAVVCASITGFVAVDAFCFFRPRPAALHLAGAVAAVTAVNRPGFSGGSVLPAAAAAGQGCDGSTRPRIRLAGRGRCCRAAGSR